MTVNALRKSNNAEEETVTLAKSLIKSWKKLVPEANDKKEEKKKEEKSVEKKLVPEANDKKEEKKKEEK